MTLHQSYFARAMLEHSSDPIGSPYAASFLVTYRTALGLIKIIHRGYVNAPLILRRTWVAWARTLICAVSLSFISLFYSFLLRFLFYGFPSVLGPILSFLFTFFFFGWLFGSLINTYNLFGLQIIIGIVAVRSPGLSFAREAFKELGAAVELFEKADFHPVTRHGVVSSFSNTS